MESRSRSAIACCRTALGNNQPAAIWDTSMALRSVCRPGMDGEIASHPMRSPGVSSTLP